MDYFDNIVYSPTPSIVTLSPISADTVYAVP
jgi:hypothetical protein